MSTGTTTNPVCSNTTAAVIAIPAGVKAFSTPADPVCEVITPPGATQTATPSAN